MAGVSRGLFCPGRAASQGLKSSMCRRVMLASDVAGGAVSARNVANERSARSAPDTLPGRSTQAIWVRYRRIGMVTAGSPVRAVPIRAAAPGRSLGAWHGESGEGLGVDGFSGPPVLAREPVITQVQVNAG